MKITLNNEIRSVSGLLNELTVYTPGVYECEIGTSDIRILHPSGKRLYISYIYAHKYIKEIGKPPGTATLERYVSDGIARSVFGAKVDLDGYDDKGGPSWLLALGLI